MTPELLAEYKEFVMEIDLLRRLHRDFLNQEPRMLNLLKELQQVAKNKYANDAKDWVH